jgi:hypothetical protein
MMAERPVFDKHLYLVVLTPNRKDSRPVTSSVSDIRTNSSTPFLKTSLNRVPNVVKHQDRIINCFIWEYLYMYLRNLNTTFQQELQQRTTGTEHKTLKERSL